MGMDIKATYTKHYISCLERPNLLVTQKFPPRWNFPSGALFERSFFFFQNYHNRFPHGVKITAPKVLHGLMAAGTDIWVRELSRKTLGQSYIPATVRVAHLLLALSNTGCSPVLSLFDVLFSCTILVSLDVQLLRNDTHNCRDVLLSMGLFCSSH
jgi:hypothetical protein